MNDELLKGLILGMVFLIGILSVMYFLFTIRFNAINNFFCQQTSTVRSMLSNYLGDFLTSIINDVFKSDAFNTIPLICSKNKIIINPLTEDADKVIANEIISCWEKFGADTQDGVFPNPDFLCSVIGYESDNPDNYVDLMRVYSIVYNRTNMKNFESFSMGNNYWFDYNNPFRFCIDEPYNKYFIKKLLYNGIILGEFKNGVLVGNKSLRTFDATSSTLLLNNLAASSNLVSIVLDALSFIPLPEYLPTCFSLKEGALNIFRLNASLKYVNVSSRINYKKFDEVVTPLALASEFNQNSKIYQGTFYVKFFDFAYYMNPFSSRGAFKFSETNSYLYPNGALISDYLVDHDYVALGYTPEIKLTESGG
jgi:hypothetical protein